MTHPFGGSVARRYFPDHEARGALLARGFRVLYRIVKACGCGRRLVVGRVQAPATIVAYATGIIFLAMADLDEL
ncbi:hypothetical protein CO675_21610 [Bradyrhizobium sp. C9]|nr:hypothetical protein CO675_21610 [Bradyrhizobium sp. C9]